MGLNIEIELAAYLVVSRQFGSTAFLQRAMRLRPERARELMAALEHAGIVGPEAADGASARRVLIPTTRLEEIGRLVGPAAADHQATRQGTGDAEMARNAHEESAPSLCNVAGGQSTAMHAHVVEN